MDREQALNAQHLECPRPGDYWHEMFMPICVVLSASDDCICLCSKTTSVEGNRWTWDLTETRTLSKKEFSKWLSYTAIPGTWARVMPEAHSWFLGVADG